MKRITLLLFIITLLSGVVSAQVRVNLLICDTMGVSINKAFVRTQKPVGEKLPKELRRAISSDRNGQVSLSILPGDKITISAQGFTSQWITFVADSIKSSYAIVLIPASESEKASRSTGAVVGRSVNSLGSGGDMLSFLQRAASGVTVEKQGESYLFYVRGMGSITGSDSALVLIDGSPGEVGMLNVDDIDSVTVLKDASSIAIYGSRAAFGVVLIKTKKVGK